MKIKKRNYANIRNKNIPNADQFFKKIILYKLEQGMEIFPKKNKRKRDNTDVNDIRISQRKKTKAR